MNKTLNFLIIYHSTERKAKEAEVQMREIARRAREEHRKSILDDNSTNSSPAASLDIAVPRPPNQEAVVQWYRNTEFPKRTGIDPSGKLEKWFHGLLNRNDAEAQLANEEQGTFLVRISEKIWGYAISYKDVDRYKHYLVDASNGKYQFLGQNQLTHNSLSEYNFYIKRSIKEYRAHEILFLFFQVISLNIIQLFLSQYLVTNSC